MLFYQLIFFFFRINLNILECKVILYKTSTNICSGINLNILECKAVYIFVYKSVVSCINLNILECKEENLTKTLKTFKY